MAGQGRIYRRGQMFFIAYSDRGREFRESTRSRDIEDAKRLLAERLAACQPARPMVMVGVAFVTLCELYLDEYRLRQFRTPDTAGGRVKNLRAFFDDIPANAISTADLRAYQATRRRQNAAAATINRETAALTHVSADDGARPSPHDAGVPHNAARESAEAGILRTRRIPRGPTLSASPVSRCARFCVLLRVATPRNHRTDLGRN